MKKLDRSKKRFRLRAAEKRFIRSLRSNNPAPKKNRRSKRGAGFVKPIEAPTKIDIYMSKNRSQFIRFIEAVKRKADPQKTIFISFRNSESITASAGLLLVAEIDKIVRAMPGLKIKCSLPPKVSKGSFKKSENLVESALKQIGFFDLIGQSSLKQTNQVSVRRWQQLSGEVADGSLAASLIGRLSERLPPKARKRLYRGAIEAIANCVEHAYPDRVPSEETSLSVDSRWWMLVGMDDDIISIVVCDLGVGIPATLPKHPENLLLRIFEKFSISGRNDAELIRASTYLRRTRTELSNRGKGGEDVRSIVEAFPSAQLTIRSNRGSYTITGADCRNAHKEKKRNFIDGTNQKESISSYNERISGTIIEWTLSTKDIVK